MSTICRHFVALEPPSLWSPWADAHAMRCHHFVIAVFEHEESARARACAIDCDERPLIAAAC